MSPSGDSVIQNDAVELVLAVQDWPVSKDPDLGIGPHVVVQVDDQPLIRLDQLTDGQLRLPLVDLTPGSHRFSAWAAYPWGEAVTAPGASLQGRLHFWQRQNATQPSADASWVVPIPPTGQQSQQPLMLDWLIWNAPLQNLRDGDGRWRIRLSIDGDSFLTDQQEAIWLKGTGSKATTVQVELLNGQGEPLQPVFNNRLVRLKDGSRDRPVWLKARLSEDELERLSGTPRQKLIDPEPSLDVSPELNEEPEQEEGQDVTDAEKDDEPLDAAPGLVIAPSQEPSPALEPETTPESDPSIALPPEPITEQKEPEPEPVPMHQSEPLLRPESSREDRSGAAESGWTSQAALGHSLPAPALTSPTTAHHSASASACPPPARPCWIACAAMRSTSPSARMERSKRLRDHWQEENPLVRWRSGRCDPSDRTTTTRPGAGPGRPCARSTGAVGHSPARGPQQFC